MFSVHIRPEELEHAIVFELSLRKTRHGYHMIAIVLQKLRLVPFNSSGLV